MRGWTRPPDQCFRLIDDFYRRGYRQVDTATNYPINKVPEAFRAAEKILWEWINAHGVKDLEMIIKVGSTNNLKTPDCNLRKSFLLFNLDDYLHRFGSNLHTFMIHWDDRSEKEEISDSLEALQEATVCGLQVGLSGIRHPEVYAIANEHFLLDFRIQLKHNLFHSDIDRYEALVPYEGFLAYGINAGGVKLEVRQYGPDSTLLARGGDQVITPLQQKLLARLPAWNRKRLPAPITTFNQLGMINACHHPKIGGIIIGPGTPAQLGESCEFFGFLQQGAYQSIYEELCSIN